MIFLLKRSVPSALAHMSPIISSILIFILLLFSFSFFPFLFLSVPSKIKYTDLHKKLEVALVLKTIIFLIEHGIKTIYIYICMYVLIFNF